MSVSMSNTAGSDAGTDRPDFSLTKAVEDVSKHGCAQTEALRDKQKHLLALQATLAEVENKGEMAEQELRAKVRESLMLEGEVEHLERQVRVLRDRCVSIGEDVAALQSDVMELEEDARTAQATFAAYRDKMEGHRTAVLNVTSHTDAHRELEEKRALVRMLRQKKEELREDLENPSGNAVQMAKREKAALQEKVSMMEETIAEKRALLQKELDTQSQINKDIEIQNRRYEAIVKRLRCQLSRAQAVRRLMCEEVSCMERQISELKGRLRSSVNDH